MKKEIRYYIKEKSILNIIFILCFFIYLKKLPIDIETQPFILFSLGLFLLFFKRIKLSIVDLLLILHLVILTFYLTIQFSIFQTGIIAYFTYLVGPVIYLSFKNSIQLISLKVVKLITLLYVVLATIIFLKIPFLYEVIKWFYSVFISRPGWIEGSTIRGFSLLAPEPSYFAFSAVLLFVLLDFFNHKNNKWYKLALLTVVILSKSALVFGYVFIYLFFYYLGDKPLKLIKKISYQKIRVILGLFIVVLIALFFVDSRVSQVYDNIAHYFSTNGGFKKLLIREESGSFRFIINSYAFLSIEHAPFGWGIGEFQYHYRVITNQFNDFASQFYSFRQAFKNNTPIKAQTYFANLIADIGVFSIWGFIFVFSSIFKNTGNKIKRGVQWLVPLMLIIVQAQISNPIPWILLAFINSSNINKEKKLVSKT